MSGAAEIEALAAELTSTSREMVKPMRRVFEGVGEKVADEWADNARETSGVHGRHYPNSIDSELRFGFGDIVAEVGPNRAKKQGSMGRGFEFGSVNQPPHLDGAQAVDKLSPLVSRTVSLAVEDLLP